MEGPRMTLLIRWPKAVRWATSVSLAMLFLVVLLYGLREATLVRADPGTRYVDGSSGSDTTDCADPANPCAAIGYALDQADDGDPIIISSLALPKPEACAIMQPTQKPCGVDSTQASGQGTCPMSCTRPLQDTGQVQGGSIALAAPG